MTAVSAVRRIAVGALRPLGRATSAAVTDRTDVTTLHVNYSEPRKDDCTSSIVSFDPQLSRLHRTLFFSTHCSRRVVGEVVEG